MLSNGTSIVWIRSNINIYINIMERIKVEKSWDFLLYNQHKFF